MKYTEEINGESIQDWDSSHDEFQMKLGFFEGYGRNMDAWIDCMSDLFTNGEYKSLTKLNLNDGDTLVLVVQNSDQWKKQSPETYDEFIDCSVIVIKDRNTNIALELK